MEERADSRDVPEISTAGAAVVRSAPSKLSLLRQVRALGAAARSCKTSPAAVVGTALKVWCDHEYATLPACGLPRSSKLETTAALHRFVETLRRLGFLEATYWLSSTYAMLTDESTRKRLAMFFTPASITKGLLDDLSAQGVDFSTESFLDPACGGAAFLAPIALRMRDALRQKGASAVEIVSHIEAHLYGTDLDETLCALSVHFLHMALHEEIRQAGYTPAFKVHRANSLTDLRSMFGQMDVVICNPPYRKMTADELEPLRSEFGHVIESQPNLYGLFIALCVNLLRPEGRAALVTPTSFLSGQYFSALRRFLACNTVVEHIGMVSDRLGVFIDVEQETALTVLRRSPSGQGTDERTTDVSVVSSAGIYQNVGKCSLASSGDVWPIPRSVADVELLRSASKSTFRLSDYGYRVRIGAYVWNRDKRPKFTCAKALGAAKTRTAVPLIWSSDIWPGKAVTCTGESRADGGAQFVDLGDRAHPSVVTQPSVVVQRVTANDQPCRLVAAAVSPTVFQAFGGFVGENHVVVLEQATAKPAISPPKLARLLSAPAVERYFRCISGATNVSAFELRQLALPDPQALKHALAKGLSMDEAAGAAFGL